MSGEQEQGHKAGYGWLIFFPIMVILYALSIGQAGAIAKKSGVRRETFRRFYYPLVLLHDYTPLEKPLEAYLDLWGVK